MTDAEMKHIVTSLDWEKRWMLKLTPLSVSYLGAQYHFEFKKAWGMQYDHVTFSVRDGVASCYQLISENKNYGSGLATIIESDRSHASQWAHNLKVKSDAIDELCKEPVEDFLDFEVFKKFEKLYNEYLPAHVAISRVVNYLSETTLKAVESELKEVRVYAEPIYTVADDFFRSLLLAIANKERRDYKYVQLILKNELYDYFTRKVLVGDDVLQRRKDHYGLYFENGIQQEMTGKEISEFEDILADKLGVSSGAVKGTAAVRGVARGVARIVMDPSKVKIFNEGDILVTGMTHPEFVPLMKKASAIVTDAGGILCHAAIVARELKKVCLIGTQTATAVIKDGDMVEVDANKGIVTKR